MGQKGMDNGDIMRRGHDGTGTQWDWSTMGGPHYFGLHRKIRVAHRSSIPADGTEDDFTDVEGSETK